MIRSAERASAFSLIEITLALGVAAFALLSLLGLLATGSQVNRAATQQSGSFDLMTAVAADLRATPAANTTSTQYGITIPPNPVNGTNAVTLFFDSAGQSSTSVSADSRFRLVVTFLPNAGGRTATRVDLRVTAPAAADPANNATEAAEMFLALDRN